MPNLADSTPPSKQEIAVNSERLRSLIERAATGLSSATSAAEILDARDQASLVYDLSKKTAHLAKMRGAHDEVIAACHRAQADALVIEAQAKCRLADEYDKAQERGEVQKAGGDRKSEINIPNGNNDPLTVTDIGLNSKQIHEARTVRDAEQREPGIVEKTVKEKLDSGEEPRRADVKRAVKGTARPKRTAANKTTPGQNTQEAGSKESNKKTDMEALDAARKTYLSKAKVLIAAERSGEYERIGKALKIKPPAAAENDQRQKALAEVPAVLIQSLAELPGDCADKVRKIFREGAKTFLKLYPKVIEVKPMVGLTSSISCWRDRKDERIYWHNNAEPVSKPQGPFASVAEAQADAEKVLFGPEAVGKVEWTVPWKVAAGGKSNNGE